MGWIAVFGVVSLYKFMYMGVTDFILAIVGMIVGGGASWIFLLKSTKTKARAEAMKEVQDVYQETIQDLREDKRILKEEREDDRMKYKELEDRFLQLEKNQRVMNTDIKLLKDKNIKERCLNFSCKERISE